LRRDCLMRLAWKITRMAAIASLFLQSLGCLHLNNARNNASHKITEMAQSVDSFFAEPRALEEYENTRLILSGGLIFKEQGKMLFSGHNQFRIALPGLKEKWGVLIGGSSDRDEFELKNLDQADQGQYESFLRFFTSKDRRIDWDFDVGLKYNSGAKYFGRLTGRYDNQWNECPYRIIERIYWLNDDGFGEKSRFEIDQLATPKMLIREYAEFEWSEISEGLDIRYGVYLRSQINAGLGVGFEWLNYAHTNEWSFDYFDLVARVRKTVYWPWLEAELAPRLRFNRDSGVNFSTAPSVEFTLSIRLDSQSLE
jgi:hypothetical protein